MKIELVNHEGKVLAKAETKDQHSPVMMDYVSCGKPERVVYYYNGLTGGAYLSSIEGEMYPNCKIKLTPSPEGFCK